MADFSSTIANLKRGAAAIAGTVLFVSFVVGAQEDPDLLGRLTGAACGAAVFALAFLRFPAIATRNRFALFVTFGIAVARYPTSIAEFGAWLGKGLSTAAIVGISCLLIEHGLRPFIPMVPVRWRVFAVIACSAGVAAVALAPTLNARSLDGHWEAEWGKNITLEVTLDDRSSRVTGSGVFATEGRGFPVRISGVTSHPNASLILRMYENEWVYSGQLDRSGSSMIGTIRTSEAEFPLTFVRR